MRNYLARMVNVYLDIFIYLILGINLLLGVWLLRIELRLKKFLQGNDAKSLEGLISSLSRNVDDLEKFQKEATQAMSLLNERIATSIRGVGLVRFNPFKGKGFGGDQSFAVALMDVDGNGLVISSLYTQERVSTYAKPLNNFLSNYDLTDEEKKAIEEARKRI